MVLKSFLVKDKLDTTVGEAGVGTAAFVNLPVQRSMNTAYSFAVLLHLLEFPPLPPIGEARRASPLDFITLLCMIPQQVSSLTRMREHRPLASYFSRRLTGKSSGCATLNPPFCWR